MSHSAHKTQCVAWSPTGRPLHWLVAVVLLAAAAAVGSAVLAWQVDLLFFLAFPFALTGAYGAWLGMTPSRVLDAAAAGEQDAGSGPAGSGAGMAAECPT